MDQNLMSDIYGMPADRAWERIFVNLWNTFSPPVRIEVVDAMTTERDRAVAVLDNLLSGSAWGLWQQFIENAPRTSQALKDFWGSCSGGKAILILDAISLRETPIILEQAKARGYTVHDGRVTGAEIPGDTVPFAKALGFSQRSNLANNGGKSSNFPNAWTESTDLPFADCANLVKADPEVIFWHHWPDVQMHEFADEGNGYRLLAKAAGQMLTSDDFWTFVDRLTTGRRLIITGDHGYANSGLFPDVAHKDQADYLKGLFKSGRSTQVSGNNDPHYWVPPLTQIIDSDHGTWQLALGRRKWKSQGGYPTITHGGLTLLELAVPFIEISK
jgi:hypothetical protein